MNVAKSCLGKNPVKAAPEKRGIFTRDVAKRYWLPLLLVLLCRPVLADSATAVGNASGATKTEAPEKLPPCPKTASEREQVSPYYFALCAQVDLSKRTESTAADGTPLIPPRPDYIPKELPPCPTWNPKTLISPYFPCPGQQLGLPKDEAIAALKPEIRAFLDGVLRLYREPGLFTRYQDTLAVFGLQTNERRWMKPSTGEAHMPLPFRESLKGGVVARPAWSAAYDCCNYWLRGDPDTHHWRNQLTFKIDQDDECISSRAVEGYLDLYLYPNFLFGGPHPKPPEDWYRHGRVGGASAKALSSNTPEIELGYIAGCLVRLQINGHFFLKEYSSDRIYN